MKIPTSHDLVAGEIIPGEIRRFSDIGKSSLMVLNNFGCPHLAAIPPSVDLLWSVPNIEKHILQEYEGRNVIRLRRKSAVYISAESGGLSRRPSEDHNGFSGRGLKHSLVPNGLHIDITTRIHHSVGIARGNTFNHADAVHRDLLVDGADGVPRFVNGFYRWQSSSRGAYEL